MEKRLKNIQTFEQHLSELNISDVSDSKNKYTVVSFDYKQMTLLINFYYH